MQEIDRREFLKFRANLEHIINFIEVQINLSRLVNNHIIKWKNKDGLPFDPWLRVHVRKNAKIINACKKAVEIKGTFTQWKSWTNIKFPESGKYAVEGALCPVVINREKTWELILSRMFGFLTAILEKGKMFA